MRLDLLYYLTLFVPVPPSISKTHKVMAFGDKVSASNPKQ